MGQRSRTLGMLINGTNNPFFADVMCGVEEGCFVNGYGLLISNCGPSVDRQLRYMDRLLQTGLDGLIVMTVRRSDAFQQALERLDDLPKVVLDTNPFPHACAIGDDSFLGARLATDFLIGRGFERIGCITGPVGHPRSAERFRGFEFALHDVGRRAEPDLVARGDLTLKGGYAAMKHLLDAGRRPNAIFAFNDLMAMGAYRAIQERRLRIPEDISVVGYDDQDISEMMMPALTTVRQPSFDLGVQSAEILIRHLEDGAPIPPILQLVPELVVRASVRQ